MKIAYVSDLHHEFGSQVDVQLQERVDVLVLAGDIDAGFKVVNRALFIGNGLANNIVFVCGNHEFYGQRVDKVHTRINLDLHRYYEERSNEDPEIFFLNNTSVTIDDITFVGGTMWTDFGLDGNPPLAMMNAEGGMNDYRRIKFLDDQGNYRKLRARDVLNFHNKTKDFLWDEIGKAYEENRLDKLVVVTHHGPTHMSIDPDFISSNMNAAYVVNWGHRISFTGPKLWFHGHTHHACEYDVGETTVMCNPYGYPGQNVNAGIKITEI